MLAITHASGPNRSTADLAERVARELAAAGTTKSARTLELAIDVAALARLLALLQLDR